MLDSRMEMTDERFSKLEGRLIEIIQCKQLREKLDRVSLNCETIPKGITFMSLKSGKERRNSVVQKKYLKK